MDVVHQPQQQRNSITIKPITRPAPAPSPSIRQVHAIQPLPPSQIPHFPPEHVLLHRDDATSKVFLSLARSLLSVDNRATTVKDLADLAMNHGLGCQNSSAATQAITTYLRTHNERCELENDGPLLLSHSMSGTDADDDLIPCLYSLQGGNPKTLSPERKTNFRKNTTVWYLSRATGAPCPFARAGIRLCDYVGLGEEEPEKDQKRRKHKLLERQLAGQKRKRSLRTRACRSETESGDEEDQDQPPQKKLTLRIKLSSVSVTPRPTPEQSQPVSDEDSSDDELSMDVDGCSVCPGSKPEEEEEEEEEEAEEEWRLPPYPRRSISIPFYAPAAEGAHSLHFDNRYRSPSTYSMGSAPPESEDEAGDFHITMTRTDRLPDEFSSDEESEGETQFESPGPRSPSAPFLPPAVPIAVKEEPRDVQGILDAWDDFDSELAEPKEVLYEYAPAVKLEPVDEWEWDTEPTVRVKQEELSFDSLFPPDHSFSPLSLSSLSSSSSSPNGSTAPSPPRSSPKLSRLRSKTEPVFSPQSSASPLCPPAYASRESQPLSPTITSLIDSMNSLCSPAISPSSLILNPNSPVSPEPTPVVDASPPCNPPITALQIEGISVYRMVLGASHFLRRIDTDFVNLSCITGYTNTPLNSVHNPIHNFPCITQGSPAVVGIWVPLSVAQEYVKDHPTEDSVFDVFLSDQLHGRFPSALQEFVKSSAHTRSLNQFGPHFASTLEAQRMSTKQATSQHVMSPASEPFTLSPAMAVSAKHPTEVDDTPLNEAEQEIFEMCVVPDWDHDGEGACPSAISMRPSLDADMRAEEEEEEETCNGNVSDASSLSSIESLPKAGEDVPLPSPPQAIKGGDAEIDSSVMEAPPTEGEGCDPPRTKRKVGLTRSSGPLRRSKRVADLAAGGAPPASINTRSRRRGSRNSLS